MSYYCKLYSVRIKKFKTFFTTKYLIKVIVFVNFIKISIKYGVICKEHRKTGIYSKKSFSDDLLY